jgi:hypothetical protein
MSDVVQQSSPPNQSSLILVESQFISHLAGHVRYAKSVVKSGMQSSRINKRCHRELSNSPKPLDDVEINECNLFTVETNEVVHRVTKFEFGHSGLLFASKSATNSIPRFFDHLQF